METNLETILNEQQNKTKSVEKLPPIELEAHRWVEIRLFISSTFVDTHGERDTLINKVIPKLNRELKKRFMEIIPIDLRWGVTKEESKNCEAIQRTCLNEIDHCRFNKDVYPFFLGLRTQRYGWVQEELLAQSGYENPEFYEWVKTLEEHKKTVSITSLECIHAAITLVNGLPFQTMFIYERNIMNPEDIEELFR